VDSHARNEVHVVGRLAAQAEQRELPSGDLLTSWRLVVDRPPGRRKAPEGARETTLDTLDCVAWTAGLQRSAAGWEPGDVISVEGAVRRRFWRVPAGGIGSRYEIEVLKAKRVVKAA
jgi:single-strand DNA-binding protein